MYQPPANAKKVKFDGGTNAMDGPTDGQTNGRTKRVVESRAGELKVFSINGTPLTYI